MSKLCFEYSMRLYYSEEVNPCHFTIKCIPPDTDRQKVEKLSIDMDPRAEYSFGTDGFGNNKIIGALWENHDHYYLNIKGEVSILQLLYEEPVIESQVGMYKYPFGKTLYSEKLKGYAACLEEELSANNVEKPYDKALFVMHKLFEYLKYDTDATNVDTSAAEAFELGRGVCQDYAHIFICIARLMGIPCRYVVGLMTGEGASHAWVEILGKGKWIGLDPTNNLLVDDNYIKLGHGRDAADCKINLGIMRGGGDQRQEIEVKVWKE